MKMLKENIATAMFASYGMNCLVCYKITITKNHALVVCMVNWENRYTAANVVSVRNS